MEDLAVRLIVAVGIAASATGVALASRSGRARRRRPFRSTGLAPGIHLFSSETCPSCERARSILVGSGLSFVEHSYESDAAVLETNGIERVPTVAWVPDGGLPGWLDEGVPTERALVRWVGP